MESISPGQDRLFHLIDVLHLQFDHANKFPEIQDVTALLYDIELVHDFALLVSEEEYSSFRFTRHFLYRNGRPIRQCHKARIMRISLGSPIILEIIIPSIATIMGILKILELLSNRKLKREKLELEVEKLREENEERRKQSRIRDLQIENIAEQRKAVAELRILIKRLDVSAFSLTVAQVKKLPLPKCKTQQESNSDSEGGISSS